MKRLFLYALVGLTPAIFLSACSGPGPFPRGYVHHGERFKSPAPGPSSKFSEAQRKSMTPVQSRQIRYGVQELITQLTDRAGFAPKPVYVQTADPLPPFYARMDNDVRDVLAQSGYRLSDTPEGAYVFHYDAKKIVPPKIADAQNFNRQPTLSLAIQVYDGAGKDARLLTTQMGDFYVEGAEALDVPQAQFKIMQKAGE